MIGGLDPQEASVFKIYFIHSEDLVYFKISLQF